MKHYYDQIQHDEIHDPSMQHSFARSNVIHTKSEYQNAFDSSFPTNSVTVLINKTKPNVLWSKLPMTTHQQYKARAKKLNETPDVGQFVSLTQLPWITSSNDYKEILEKEIFEYLGSDWKRFVKQMNGAITNPPKKQLSQRYISYPNAKVSVGSQSYHKISVGTSLLKLLFGNNMSKLKQHDEIVHSSQNLVIIHISSSQRMSQLFSHAGLCASSVLLSTKINYEACGKVLLVDSDQKHIMGYIMKEEKYCGMFT